MLLPKGSYSAGEKLTVDRKTNIFFTLGIIGACILLYGLFNSPGQIYYVVGSMLLFFTAFYFKIVYFIALEIILMAGHGAILLGIGPYLQIALPVLLCTQLFVYFLLSGQIKNIYILIGIAGIGLLSIGLSYENQWIFFFGSLAVAIYAFYNAFKGIPIALLWAILNSLFAVTAVIKLIID